MAETGPGPWNNFNKEEGHRVVLHPANRAAHLYKGGTSDAPKRVDQFYLVFNLYPTPDDFLASKKKYIETFRNRLHFLCHTAEGPKFQIQQDVMNQYNRKRIINRKLDFDPMTVRMYDTIDGLGMRFLKLLYEFEFQGARLYKERDGGEFGTNTSGKFNNSEVSNYQESVLTNEGNFENTHNFGMIAQRGSYHRLVKSIDFYQVAGRLFSKARMIHPRLSRFDMDQYDYSSSAIANLSMAFQYENLLFEEVAVRIEDATTSKTNGIDLESAFGESVNTYKDWVRPHETPLFKDSQLPPEENKKLPPKPPVVTTPSSTYNAYDRTYSNDTGEFGGVEVDKHTGEAFSLAQQHGEEFAMTKSVTDKYKLPDGTYDKSYEGTLDGGNIHKDMAHSREFDGTIEGVGVGQIHANEYSVKSTVDYDALSSSVSSKTEALAKSTSLNSSQMKDELDKLIANGPASDTTEAKKAFKEKTTVYEQAIENKKKDEANNEEDIWIA